MSVSLDRSPTTAKGMMGDGGIILFVIKIVIEFVLAGESASRMRRMWCEAVVVSWRRRFLLLCLRGSARPQRYL